MKEVNFSIEEDIMPEIGDLDYSFEFIDKMFLS